MHGTTFLKQHCSIGALTSSQSRAAVLLLHLPSVNTSRFVRIMPKPKTSAVLRGQQDLFSSFQKQSEKVGCGATSQQRTATKNRPFYGRKENNKRSARNDHHDDNTEQASFRRVGIAGCGAIALATAALPADAFIFK